MPRTSRSHPWPWHICPFSPRRARGMPSLAQRTSSKEQKFPANAASLLPYVKMSCTWRGRRSDANKTSGWRKHLDEHPFTALRVNPHFNPQVLKTGKLLVLPAFPWRVFPCGKAPVHRGFMLCGKGSCPWHRRSKECPGKRCCGVHASRISCTHKV